MKRTFAACLSICLFLATFNDVSAYGLLGMKRARINGIGYSVDSNMNSTNRSSLNNAISMWENTPTNSSISFNQSSSYTTNFTAQNFGNIEWSGHTTSVATNGIISMSYVSLNTYFTDSYASYKRDAVWAHEIGHVLGLDDVTNEYTLMHYNDDRKVWNPGTDEINGINYLY